MLSILPTSVCYALFAYPGEQWLFLIQLPLTAHTSFPAFLSENTRYSGLFYSHLYLGLFFPFDCKLKVEFILFIFVALCILISVTF